MGSEMCIRDRVAISVPLAATKGRVRVWAVSMGDAGNTQASAPESTNMWLWLARSQIVIVFVDVLPAATTPNGRLARFLMPRSEGLQAWA